MLRAGLRHSRHVVDQQVVRGGGNGNAHHYERLDRLGWLTLRQDLQVRQPQDERHEDRQVEKRK